MSDPLKQPTTEESLFERALKNLTAQTRNQIPTLKMDAAETEVCVYLVIVPTTEEPKIETYPSMEALRDRLETLVSEQAEARCFMFYGTRLFTTEGSNPCLMHPDGTLLPLFPAAESVTKNKDGYIGADLENEVAHGIVGEFDQRDTKLTAFQQMANRMRTNPDPLAPQEDDREPVYDYMSDNPEDYEPDPDDDHVA